LLKLYDHMWTRILGLFITSKWSGRKFFKMVPFGFKVSQVNLDRNYT